MSEPWEKFMARSLAKLERVERAQAARQDRKPNSGKQNIGAAIDQSRPILENKDGTFSTEETITVGADGRYFNIPTIVDGQRVGEERAIALWRKGGNPDVGSFDALDEAENAARSRTNRIGEVRGDDRKPNGSKQNFNIDRQFPSWPGDEPNPANVIPVGMGVEPEDGYLPPEPENIRSMFQYAGDDNEDYSAGARAGRERDEEALIGGPENVRRRIGGVAPDYQSGVMTLLEGQRPAPLPSLEQARANAVGERQRRLDDARFGLDPGTLGPFEPAIVAISEGIRAQRPDRLPGSNMQNVFEGLNHALLADPSTGRRDAVSRRNFDYQYGAPWDIGQMLEGNEGAADRDLRTEDQRANQRLADSMDPTFLGEDEITITAPSRPERFTEAAAGLLTQDSWETPEDRRQGLANPFLAVGDFASDLWTMPGQSQEEQAMREAGALFDYGLSGRESDLRRAQVAAAEYGVNAGTSAIELTPAGFAGDVASLGRVGARGVAREGADALPARRLGEDAPMGFEGAPRRQAEPIDAEFRTAPQRAFQAAVRDPETGRTYTGLDHMEAIDSAPDAATRARLEQIYNAPTEDPNAVGFVVNGQFMSREDGLQALRAQRAPRPQRGGETLDWLGHDRLIRNPTEADLARLSELGDEMKYVMDMDGNVYAFSAADAHHNTVMRALRDNGVTVRPLGPGAEVTDPDAAGFIWRNADGSFVHENADMVETGPYSAFAQRTRAPEGRVRIGEQVNRDGSVTERDPIDWDAPVAPERSALRDLGLGAAAGVGAGFGADALLNQEANADNGEEGDGGEPLLPILGGIAGAALASRGGRNMRSQVNMFAGPNARTADRAALTRAQEMAASGASRDEIWANTGWFQGVDGKWRFEIDDSQAFVKGGDMPMSESARRWGPGFVGDYSSGVMAHPDLAAAYPAMRDVTAGGRPGVGGQFESARLVLDDIDVPWGGRITIGDDYRGADKTSVALHEGQHVIQLEEDFARGGSADSFTQQRESQMARDAVSWRREMDLAARENPGVTDLSALDNIVAEKYAAMGAPDWVPSREARDVAMDRAGNPNEQLEEIMRVYGLDRNVSPMTPREGYRRLAGETEARNVQTRRDFTPEERRARPPWETQDVPDDQQIIRFDGGRAESRRIGEPEGNPAPPTRRLGQPDAPDAGGGRGGNVGGEIQDNRLYAGSTAGIGDMHELRSESGRLEYRRGPDEWRIKYVLVRPSQRGQGSGVALYEDLIRRAREAGVPRVRSDASVSEEALRVWEALERRGYNIARGEGAGQTGVTFTVDTTAPPRPAPDVGNAAPNAPARGNGPTSLQPDDIEGAPARNVPAPRVEMINDARLTPDESYAASRARAGLAPREIAAEMDTSPESVRVLLSRARDNAPDLDIGLSQPGRPRGGDGMTQRVAELKAEGLSRAEIAERTGLTPQQVNSRLASASNLRRQGRLGEAALVAGIGGGAVAFGDEAYAQLAGEDGVIEIAGMQIDPNGDPPSFRSAQGEPTVSGEYMIQEFGDGSRHVFRMDRSGERLNPEYVGELIGTASSAPRLGEGSGRVLSEGVTESRLPPPMEDQTQNELPEWARIAGGIGAGVVTRSGARRLGLQGLAADAPAFGAAFGVNTIMGGDRGEALFTGAAAPLSARLLNQGGQVVARAYDNFDAVNPRRIGRQSEPMLGEILLNRFGYVDPARIGQQNEALMMDPQFIARRDAFASQLPPEAPRAREMVIQADPFDRYASGRAPNGRVTDAAEMGEQGYYRDAAPRLGATAPRDEFADLSPAEQEAWMNRVGFDTPRTPQNPDTGRIGVTRGLEARPPEPPPPPPPADPFVRPGSGESVFGEQPTPRPQRKPRQPPPPLAERAAVKGSQGAMQGVKAATMRSIADDLGISTDGVKATDLRRTLVRELARQFDSTQEMVAFLRRYGVTAAALGIGVGGAQMVTEPEVRM